MKSFSLLSRFLIYLITKGDAANADYAQKRREILKTIEIAVHYQIPLIQIREKQLSARQLFELTAEAVKIAENSNTKILVNDRADIALAANAHGVHLTEKSLSAAIIRANFPKDFIVGVSAHSLEKVLAAKKQKADFAVFSPVFAALNKGTPQGLEILRQICERAESFPIIGLGGIDETNYHSVAQIASGFAAIRFLNDTENLKKLSKEFYAEK